jgi:2-oxoglutarate dehydrogenase E1 component
VDQETNGEYVPLNHIKEGQARLQAYDSLLSEYALLGFEYGYSVSDPKTLVIWEAQFGDFSNGAQIVIDQFIAAAEEKWGQKSNIVLLLPHAYEGQGPEHSSARLERFLQLCAENNMQVCNLTTPANYFHLLRRQALRGVRKPLIVMAPKSLLRLPDAMSPVDRILQGEFKAVIPAGLDGSQRTHVFCSGKVYYDLTKEIKDSGSTHVAVTRLEQFYPFPAEDVVAELERLTSAERVFWLQEEPQNMGGWTFVAPLIGEALREVRDGTVELNYAGRPASASTATGSARRHAETQTALLRSVLD